MAKLPMPGKVPQRKAIAMGRTPVAVAPPAVTPLALKGGGAVGHKDGKSATAHHNTHKKALLSKHRAGSGKMNSTDYDCY